MKLKFYLAALVLASLCLSALAGVPGKERKKSMKSWDNYEITTVKVGVDGTKFVKVWGFGSSQDKAIMAAKQNAVHACIFRGLPGSETAMSTPALCSPDVLDQYEEYFQDFFADGGPWLAYITLTTDGVPSGTDVRKVKGGKKVGLYISIMYDNLKKKLENDGVIRKLSSGF